MDGLAAFNREIRVSVRVCWRVLALRAQETSRRRCLSFPSPSFEDSPGAFSVSSPLRIAGAVRSSSPSDSESVYSRKWSLRLCGGTCGTSTDTGGAI